MGRRKLIRTSELKAVLAEDWQPVVLQGSAMPWFARSIPDAVRCSIIASGQISNRLPYSSGSVRSGYLVGGVDIYRHAPEDPVTLNKDWYALVLTDDPELLVVDGPFKDNEHWISQLPTRYAGAKVIGTHDEDADEDIG